MAQTILKELTYDDSKVIVEIARRDAKGRTIDETYLTQADWSTANAKKLDVTTFNTYINTTAPATYVAQSGFKTNYLDANGVAYKTDVTSAVNALDFAELALGAAETVKIISETDGKLSVTKQTISITSSNISGTLPDSKIASAATWNAKQNKLTFDSQPTANSSNPVTSSGIKSYVDSAVGAVTQFKYEVVESLPTASASTMGEIYLIKDTHSSTDLYDEYITILVDSTYSWEKLGNTDIDLTGYVKKTTTVNGHALSSNVTVTKSDVGLGSVVNAGRDTAVTSGSSNYITSGAVYDAVAAAKATVEDFNPTLAYGTTSQVGTVDGTALQVTMPKKSYKTISFYKKGSTAKTTLTNSSARDEFILRPESGIDFVYMTNDPDSLYIKTLFKSTDVTIDLQ